jgi:hypothetical protein
MIIHEDFQWLHLPRTGGTATASWMRAAKDLCDLPLAVDCCLNSSKHDNLAVRFYRTGYRCDGKVTAMNFRSLPDWLASSYSWTRMSGFSLPLARYLCGEYFSFRTGRWCPADWWLEYFDVERVSHLLSLDNLESNWRKFLKDIASVEVPLDIKIERLNAGSDATNIKCLFEQNASQIYARNPIWEATEKKCLHHEAYFLH